MVFTRKMEQKLKDLIDQKFSEFKASMLSEIKQEFETFILQKREEISTHVLAKVEEISVNQEYKDSLQAVKDHVKDLTMKHSLLISQNIALSKSLEDLQQYTRRQSLRIFGVKVDKNEDCMAIVSELINKNKVPIPLSSVDRAHRIGKLTKNREGESVQPIIVRFTSFRDRTVFYKMRKDIRKSSGVGVVVDLTRERLSLLLKAREVVKDVQGIQFVYSDINCNLRVFTSAKTHLIFSTLDDLQAIITTM